MSSTQILVGGGPAPRGDLHQSTDCRLTRISVGPPGSFRLDLARRPPSYVPQSCAPLSNSPIRRLYEAALSPRSARDGSDAFPYSILSARSIRPLCGLLMRDCHARAPRLALYIHIALVRFSFRAPISPTYQPNLAARSRGLLDVGAFGGPCKAGRAWLVLESEACYTSPSI